jgi:mannose-6-phosphate isomerase-like protein (cupin superfamily)
VETKHDTFVLSDRPAHVGASGRIVALDGDDRFWRSLRDQSEMRTGWLVSTFRYERSWNRWERHPDADEMVTVIEGPIDFEFESEDGRRWSVSVNVGASCVVPRGIWHRAVIARPALMMFITPAPALTEERVAT